MSQHRGPGVPTRGTLAALVVLAGSVSVACEGSVTTSTPIGASSSAVPPPTSSPPAATTRPEAGGLVQTWRYPSDAIGRSLGTEDDFAVDGGRVAVLVGVEAHGVAVLDLESGEEVWQMAVPESPGTVLDFVDGRLTWATYEQVGAWSGDGEELWTHRLRDSRWPTRAVTHEDRMVVALDPTMEGDDRSPRVVQFDPSGTLVWAEELEGTRADEDLQWADPIVADGGVFIQTTDALYRLDWMTGSQDWRSPFREARVESFDTTAIAHSDGLVSASDPGGEVLVVDSITGEASVTLRTGPAPRVVGRIEGWLVYTDEQGLHGYRSRPGTTWSVDLPGVEASIEAGRIVGVSSTRLVVVRPGGEVESDASTDAGSPQQSPLLVGDVVVAPGWDGTRAIDLGSGRVLRHWPGQSHAPARRLDDRQALVGVAGDGLYLMETEPP
jgi:hypothetical protein